MFKLKIRFGYIGIVAFLLSACGGGGDGSSTTKTMNPSEELTWDQGEWDSNNWN